MTGRRWQVLASVIAAWALSVCGVAAAGAAEPETPADVRAALSLDLADEAETVPALEDAASFGPVCQVHRWSDALIAGEAGDPVTATDEWVAPVLSSAGEAVAIYRVWRERPDSAAEFAGVDADAATATALLAVDAEAALVSDPTVAAWYAVRDGVVTPVGSATFADVRGATPISEVAGIVSARYAQAVRDAAPPTGTSVAGWMWAGAGVLLLAGIGLGVGVRRRESVG